MNRVLVVIIFGMLLIVPPSVMADNPLGYNTQKFALTQRLTEGLNASPEVTEGTAKKLPGRALLLSAVIPGMGQFYAGSKLRGAVFLTLEVAGWTAFGIYQAKGKDKENEYQDFADQHWSRDAYWSAVDSIAVKYGWAGGDVRNANWEELVNNYLPQNFTHELPSTNTQQYYEMIGKYLTQFGYGWDDAMATDTTDYFSGYFTDNNPKNYNQIRYDSNQLLDRATVAVELVLVNHVISALDAAFLVRRQNKSAIETSLNVEQKMFNNQPVTMAGVKVRW
jgi:hypothetical protein